MPRPQPRGPRLRAGDFGAGCLAALLLASAACAPARAPAAPTTAAAFEEVVDLSRFLEGVEGTFVLLDVRRGRIVRHHPERARTRFLPASTFKIPNTLIALETGVAPGAELTLAWDSAAAPREGWWGASHTEDQTLRSAFRGSVVWYFQEVARRIGPARMRAHLARWGYGNGDLSAGIDRFWLEGGFAVSPDEQVEFLRHFLAGELGLSPRTEAVAREIMLLQDDGELRLSGKTGTARLPGGRLLAWLVGYAECGGEEYVYALNLEGEGDMVWNEWQAPRRITAVRSMLAELGACG